MQLPEPQHYSGATTTANSKAEGRLKDDVVGAKKRRLKSIIKKVRKNNHG